MAKRPSPVTPSVVQWAVREDGRPLLELAEKLGVDVDTLDGWMSGTAAPSVGELTKLARVLSRPRALFFLPQPPAASLPPAFRHPPGAREDASATVRVKIRRARRVQSAVSWGREGLRVEVPRASVSEPADEAAERARDWLAVTDDQQRRWADKYMALRAWRHALEARDVLVFEFELGQEGVRGFSLWDASAPLIVMNRQGVSAQARCYTIGHELGHLVLRSDSACIEPVGPEPPADHVERWCEEFAAALLMPASIVRQWVAQRLGARSPGIEDVDAMGRRFWVSSLASALRLRDVGLTDLSLYRGVKHRYESESANEGRENSGYKNPPRSRLRPRQYGIETIRTVFDTLAPVDALTLLQLDVDEARRMAENEPGIRVP